jgi:hypothetical protein
MKNREMKNEKGKGKDGKLHYGNCIGLSVKLAVFSGLTVFCRLPFAVCRILFII